MAENLEVLPRRIILGLKLSTSASPTVSAYGSSRRSRGWSKGLLSKGNRITSEIGKTAAHKA